VLALLWGAPNQLGAWTFVALWLLRWSAKLNLFLGVPNLNDDWLPEHLRYLGSYIPRRPMNLLFPVSVTAATAVTGALILGATEATTDFARAGLTLLATLLFLGLLEHWFLVLPLRDSALWSWALRLAGREPSPADRPTRRPTG
jgi:putative photosynthetic complex assembly protein 2